MAGRVVYAGAGRGSIGILAAALVTFILTLAASSGEAKALSAANIMGRWCGNVSNYTFTPTRLTVVFLNGSPRKILRVKSIKMGDDRIDVYWKPPQGSFTRFQEFSGNGMVQAPETSGDKGPRREFRRC